jgi:hypothetical protein
MFDLDVAASRGLAMVLLNYGVQRTTVVIA